MARLGAKMVSERSFVHPKKHVFGRNFLTKPAPYLFSGPKWLYGAFGGKIVPDENCAQFCLKKWSRSVITPFLPTGFSRVSARKTGQPGPSQHDPTKPRHIKYSRKEGPGHIDQIRPSLTKVWPDHWPDQKLNRTDCSLTILKNMMRASIRRFMGQKRMRNEEVMVKTVEKQSDT